eukprot:120270-Amphidinium_carterae.1
MPRESLASSCALDVSCSHDKGVKVPASRIATSLSTKACEGSVVLEMVCPGNERRNASSRSFLSGG